MNNRDELSQLRSSLGFTVEYYRDGDWVIMLEGEPWDVFGDQFDARKECHQLNNPK